jgi:2-aminoadipate transaminase
VEQWSGKTKELLGQFWQKDRYIEFANRVTQRRAGAGNLWSPPMDIQPLKPMMYLSVGIPDSEWLPRPELNRAMNAVMKRKDDAGLRYGFGRGYFPVRKYLTKKYNREKGVQSDADWFLLTNGSTMAIDLIVRSLINPGDIIITETPTYMGSLANFFGVGAVVCPVPMDQAGIKITELARQIKSLKEKGKKIKLVYVISSFQNPSGVSMTTRRKKELLQLAAEEKFLILDDDAYGDLYYHGPPSANLAALSGGAGVVTVGTFSKTVATGLRIGWIYGHPDALNLFARAKFDMGQNQMALQMMGRFLEEGHLEPHVDKMRVLYKKKMTLTADLLKKHLSDLLDFERPAGGFYLWLKLKKGLTSKAVWRTATEEGVSVSPGYACIPDTVQGKEEYIRLAYSWTPMDQLEEAVLRLSRACRRVVEGKSA